MAPASLDDLVRDVTTGRSGAARRFLDSVAPAVLRTVRQVLGARHPDVEDVVQDALLATLEALPTFRGACSVLHFVRRIALLTALGARRKAHLRQLLAPVVSGQELDALPAPFTNPAEALDAARRRLLFTTLLDKLPAAQAEAIGLHCILGFTVAEAAASAGVPLNTLRGQLVSAKTVLRQELELDSTAQELFRGVS
jgi:RNA polymerase sigma factor (sigma-70 family)